MQGETHAQLGYVHMQKVGGGLVALLEENNLAVREWQRGSQWIGMHPRLADIYMVCLTDQISISKAAHPLTDDFTAHCAVATGSHPDPAELFDALMLNNPA